MQEILMNNNLRHYGESNTKVLSKQASKARP